MAHYIASAIYLILLHVSKLGLSYAAGENLVHIGAVLDTNSPFGSMADLCIRMAISDYYLANPNHTTRLKIHVKNAENLLDVNFAVLDLLNHEDVVAIMGPQGETENMFVTELGKKALVPIISFTATSSSLSYMQNKYFVRATLDDAIQAKALAAICQGFEWPGVVVLYEGTNYGNQFLAHLNKAFQEVEIALDHVAAISALVEDSDLLKVLEMLSKRQTRVFLVHMSPSLGNRLFTLAKTIGLMSEGYAWIISDILSNFMKSMDLDTRDSMQGVLGVRPYVYHSKELESFQQRWKKNMLEKDKDSVTQLNVYGLWAYDAMTALAISVENMGPVNSTSLNVRPKKSKTDITNLRVSTVGPRLLDELSRTRFRGLTGDFQLVDGKLKQSTFEIFNVYGSGEKTIGFWTPDEGIIGELSSVGQNTYSTSIKELKNVIWPGDSVMRPNGWAIPATGKLRVGVPWKEGFTEFCRATIDFKTNHTIASGFAVDIFLAALRELPFPINYEFKIYNDSERSDWSYDEMLHNIPQNFDMIVADTTIRAPRTSYVEFSLPYTESGIVLVVKNRKAYDMWMFTKPLSWGLWLAILIACIFMGIVFRIMERDVDRDQAWRPETIYASPIVVLAFPERSMVSNRSSFIVLMFWMFMGYILMQSYTASLSAILTLDQLEFAFSDNYYVGYQEASFMQHFLTEQLHISPSRLRSYTSVEEYNHAMSIGSAKGGIDAIFDEIPYMKLFLNKYDTKYKMVGPTYKTGGFGFAFPVRSPLAAHFSKAILNVTQGPEITAIEQKNFGPGYSSQDPLSSIISQGPSSVTFWEVAGLFLIVGVVTVFALLCSFTPSRRILADWVNHFIKSCFLFRRVQPASPVVAVPVEDEQPASPVVAVPVEDEPHDLPAVPHEPPFFPDEAPPVVPHVEPHDLPVVLREGPNGQLVAHGPND